MKHLTPLILGEDDAHLDTIDADGVALVAIQGWNQKSAEKVAKS